MGNSPLNAIRTTCSRCGTIAETGRIFCTNCRAALRTTPLIPHSGKSGTRRPTRRAFISNKAILLSIAVGILLDILIDVLVPDHMMNVVFVVTISVLVVGILLVAFGTVTKNRWGINLEPVNCPACGSAMPKVRRPESLKQTLWGGGTCGKCGSEMDKWGRVITLSR